MTAIHLINNQGIEISVSVLLTQDVISTEYFINLVESASSGAVLSFSGNVRDHDHGKKVVSLTYEIHPTTREALERVVAEVSVRHNVLDVAVGHRYGDIPIGESALVVAVAAAHRKEAFVACTDLVDEIKVQIPIWKHQVFADGTDEWVNSA